MNPARCLKPLVPALIVAATSVAGAAGGLNVTPDTAFGERWAARLHIGSSTSALAGPTESTITRNPSARLLGDYYLSGPLLGTAGGVRVTSGMFLGPRGALFGAAAPSAAEPLRRLQHAMTTTDAALDAMLAWPYLGLGYSGASLGSRWGFNADLGLAAQHSGALRPERMFSQSVDDLVRDLRLRPVLQLGLSYAF